MGLRTLLYAPFLQRISVRFSQLIIDPRLREEFLILLTYLTAMSTAFPTRKDLFNKAATLPMSNPHLKQVLKKMDVLSASLGYSYVEGANTISRTTRSKLLRDFFTKMGQAMAVGDPLIHFFRRELHAYINEYSNWYDRQLRDLTGLREVFTAIAASITFISITLMILAIIFPQDPMVILYMVSVSSSLAMALIVLVLAVVVPPDRLTHMLPRRTTEEYTLRKTFLVALASAIVLAIVVFSFSKEVNLILFGTIFLIVFIPLVPVGLIGKIDERKIKSREQNFPAFVRSLGSTASSVGLSIVYALKSVKDADFGPLTEPLKNLHSSLSVGIQPEAAWNRFESETGSEMIHKYSEVMVDTISIGGAAEEVGRMVSDICQERLNLRARRMLVYSSFRGIIFPLQVTFTAIITFMNAITKVFLTFMEAYASYTGILSPPTIPLIAIDIVSLVLILTIAVANVAALKISGVSSTYSLVFERCMLFIVTGITVILISIGANLMLQSYLPALAPPTPTELRPTPPYPGL